MAACLMLKLLVTASGRDKLTVFALPDSLIDKSGALARIRTIIDPMMKDTCWLAFTGPSAATRLLLVTDVGNDAVHVIDVVHGKHVGYVAVPGSIPKPRGVAAQGTKVAVSMWSWEEVINGVCVYEGEGTTWTLTCRAHLGWLTYPQGLRFSADGTGLVVTRVSAEVSKGTVSLFRVKDLSFVQHLVTGLHGAVDVEECEGGEWAVACWSSHTVEFVVGGSHLDGNFWCPTALANLPGFALVVRHRNGGELRLFSTVDAIAMSAMSVMKTTWMATVVRGFISASE